MSEFRHVVTKWPQARCTDAVCLLPTPSGFWAKAQIVVNPMFLMKRGNDMKKLIAVSAIAMLAACGNPAPAEEEATTAEAEAPAEAMSLNETSWTFTMDGVDYFETIDADGNYITNAGEEHADHGTYVMKDGKQCFTSAMTDEGEMCWSGGSEIPVGESYDVTNDAGETLTVTRAEYTPLTM